ncbi:hypothetical protein EKI60_04280 [Candidatus Saccharibacteria bacterium]|nr:MAG: hypothetical protein EKI60_04280 [Candidatus Saccharibacteria bacterium]
MTNIDPSCESHKPPNPVQIRAMQARFPVIPGSPSAACLQAVKDFMAYLETRVPEVAGLP